MDFRHAKRNRRLHTWMIALLLTSLALGLNYLASMTKLGIDLTREDRYTLSQETLAWLVKLKRPTDVIITIRESTNQPTQRPASKSMTMAHGSLRQKPKKSE